MTVELYQSLLLGKNITSRNLGRRLPLPSPMANRSKSEYGASRVGTHGSSGCILLSYRQVALLEIQGKEFQIKPIPLRTVRPFVLEDLVLSEASEEEGFDMNDQIAVSKFLKSRVNQLTFDQTHLP